MNIEKLEISVANSAHITNTYLVYDDKKYGILVDPADESEKIISKINDLELHIEYIILTHAHFDHVNALYDMKKYTGAKILVYKDDLDMLLGKVDNTSSMFNAKNKILDERDIIAIEDEFCLKVGNLSYEIIHTPGHTEGSIIIYVKEGNVILTGDTLFAKSYGRCDLATGDFEKMVNSLRKIFVKFDDENIIIYPGHNESSNLKKVKKYIKLLLALRKIEL